MNHIKATNLYLGGLEQPVVTFYQLGVFVYKLYKEKKYKGNKIENLSKKFAERRDLMRLIRSLEDDGILNAYRNFPSNSVYSVLGKTKLSDVEILCTIDPFAYISHLSAMDYYGFTDRIPSKIFCSTPKQPDWKKFAIEKMQKDLGGDYSDYVKQDLPQLRRILVNKIGKKDIKIYSSIHLGAFRNVRDKAFRVATIGRTFLDMIKDPELCGGMSYVITVYKNYAEKYIEPIVEEINRNGGPIHKVRAGYILDEIMEIRNAKIEQWSKLAQRGGSRKLDPSAEYEPQWSDKWCISLNVL